MLGYTWNFRRGPWLICVILTAAISVRRRTITRNRKNGAFIVSIITKISFCGADMIKGDQNVISLKITIIEKNFMIGRKL